MPTRWKFSITCVLLMMTVAACSSGKSQGTQSGSGQTEDNEAVRAAVSAAPVLDAGAASRAIRVDLDDIGLVDPTPLFTNDRVSTVVVGSVADFREGPALGAFESDPHPARTTALVVDVVKSYKGDAKPGGKVYVELFGAWDPTAALKAIPRGTVVVIYGSPVDMEEPFTINPSRGKPEGATYLLPGAVGLAIVDPLGGVVFPVRGDTHADWSIENLLPASALKAG